MTGAFPQGWALMKPQQTIKPEEFNAMWKTGNYIPTRKRDGNRGHIITAGEQTRIWSRNGTLDWTDKLAHIAHNFFSAPPGYLIDVELHTDDEGTKSFQKAMNSSPEDVRWSAFDLLRLDGSLTNQSYDQRSSLLGHLEDQIDRSNWGGGVFFHLPEFADYDEALRQVEAAKCEGIVLWDRNAPHQLNLNGNTKRGKSWKIKVRQTEDLVVLRVNPGVNPSLGCGTLKVARQIVAGCPLEPINAPLGSFDVAFDRIAAMTAQTPFIVEVEHYGEDDNGNLVFPKVLRRRDDLMGDFGLLDKPKAA